MKLKFWMKSGNVLEQDDVVDWSIKSNGEEITEIYITLEEGVLFSVLVETLCLSQIECITRHE